MLLVAGGLFVYNKIFDYQAGQRAQELLDQMMSEFDWDLPPLSEIMQATASTPASSGAAKPDNAGTGSSAAATAKPLLNTETQAGSETDPETDSAEETEESHTSSGGGGGSSANQAR